MSYRKRNIALASGLAVLAVVFMLIYTSKSKSSADVGKQLVGVLVAARDIPEGTPGSALQGDALVRKLVPRDAAVPGSITARSQVRGEVAIEETLAGEQVIARRFGPIAAQGVRSRIHRLERVVQLAGDANQVLDGTLKAGDRVDVVGSWALTGGTCTACNVSRTIVRGALVLGTSADLAGSGSSTSVPVQLRLTDDEAARVFWMAKNGQWWLALRPVVDARSGSQGYDTSNSILHADLDRKGPRG
ncbi:MAG TPA: Flp pilus assembly protein CpaB [Gaiellaceae bacterium]